MRYIFILFAIFSLTFAHKINLFITNTEDKIEVYSYFANGAACNGCKMLIKNDDKIIFEDKLDSEGLYLYTPKNKNIEVIIDAGGGHIAKEKLEIKNIKKQDKNEYKKDEEKNKYLKIFFGIFILFLFFYLLKRFKK